MTGSLFSVALPETRQLDVLASLLERRGAVVIRCPLVAIKDSPDRQAVLEWIERFSAEPPDLMILFTGEGLNRLLAFAESAGQRDAFVAALGRTPLLTRGPKPARALRGLDIRPTYPAVAPTTDGVIATLADIDLAGKRVSVQLYGEDPNTRLMEYLAGRGIEPDCVAPYVYASETDDAAVASLIDNLAQGRIDAIAFTSKAQVERLAAVAEKRGLADELRTGLGRVVVAAVGPVVVDELATLNIEADVVPESDYFMKPMVSALMKRFQNQP